MSDVIKLDTSGLDRLLKSAKRNYGVQIGILRGTNERPGAQSNATIGAVHEYGFMSKNIPARSFLKVPLTERLFNDLSKIVDLVGDDVARGDFKKVMAKIGAKGVQVVDGAFRSNGYGKWDALSEKYAKAKNARGGSERILVDTGQLRRSITFKVTER